MCGSFGSWVAGPPKGANNANNILLFYYSFTFVSFCRPFLSSLFEEFLSISECQAQTRFKHQERSGITHVYPGLSCGWVSSLPIFSQVGRIVAALGT